MENIKKVIVFGATGRSGIGILRCAVQEELEVTAYVRTPSGVPEELRKDVKIVEGDILDKEKVEQAIEGNQAVLSALGTGWNLGATTVISDGCKNIISGMKKHGIRKLVVVSVAFLLPGRSPFFFLKRITEDHGRQLEAMKEESETIDWIAMMAPRIIDDVTVNPTYMVENNTMPGADRVNTGELADFMVKVLNDEDRFKKFCHGTPGISSRPKKKGWFS